MTLVTLLCSFAILASNVLQAGVPLPPPELAPPALTADLVTAQAPHTVPIPFMQAGAPAQVITSAEQLLSTAPAGQPETANIFLNFANTSLASILNYLGEQKKINIIPHKDLDGINVTLSTCNALTLTQAWDVMLTLMDANNFSLVSVGSMYRVVPAAEVGAQPLPTHTSNNMPPDSLPETSNVIRYTYFLQNMKTDAAKSILGKMIDEKNIIENQTLNALIIKDTAINLRSALKIIKELDQGGLREAIEIVPLRWVNADTVADLFNKSIISGGGDDSSSSRIIRFSGASSQKEAQYFAPGTKILSEPISNKLILLGKQNSIDRIKEFVAKYIDVSIDNAQSRLHVKELKYAQADKLKPLLDNIVKPANDKALVIEGGYKAFEDVIISAEAADEAGSAGRGSGNRLIIAANRDDWFRLESFIDQLDKPQPQVAIEVMVVDVGIEQSKQLGAQIFNLKGKPIGKNLNIEFLNLSATSRIASTVDLAATAATPPYLGMLSDATTGITLGKDGALGTANPAGNIWGVVRATFNIQNSQVVSQPYLITNNNQKCNFTLNECRVVPGKLDTSTTTAVRKNEPVNAKTFVEITPHINLEGIVDMDIQVSVAEFVPGGSADAPTKNEREIKTKTSLAIGEVLILGGLTFSKQSDVVYKTPILGDIPFISSLFKNKTKGKSESNLYAFIRPSLIKPRFEGTPDEYTQLKLDYAKYQVMKNDTYTQDKDPIQRWFFKPSNQTIKNRIADAANGVLRPIDNYTYGRARPRSVNIAEDPYFKVSESIERAKERRKQALSGMPVGKA